MTIERQRNFFGLFPKTEVLELGSRQVIYRHQDCDGLTVEFVDVIGSDVVELTTSIVVAPTDRHHAPHDQVEVLERGQINEKNIRWSRFGIARDRIVWRSG